MNVRKGSLNDSEISLPTSSEEADIVPVLTSACNKVDTCLPTIGIHSGLNSIHSCSYREEKGSNLKK